MNRALATKPWLALLLFLALAACTGMFVSNQKAIARLRVENQHLSNPAPEAPRDIGTQQDLTALRAQKEEADRLRSEIADLPKVRSEVGQLRRQVQELESLKAENTNLLTQRQMLASQKLVAGPKLPPPPFIQKSAWVESGFNTPEAAVQTFFAAASRGDLARVAQCFGNPPQRLDDNDKAQMIRAAATISGFRITGTKNVSSEEVYVLVEAAGFDRTEPMRLKRINNEWKFVADH